MFWLHKHLPAKQFLNSKQSSKGYERIIQGILRSSGYTLFLAPFTFPTIIAANFFVFDEHCVCVSCEELWGVNQFQITISVHKSKIHTLPTY